MGRKTEAVTDEALRRAFLRKLAEIRRKSRRRKKGR